MRLVIEKDQKVRMRDGVALATDVYRPDIRDRVPALVQRMPYNKESYELVNYSLDVLRAARAGYAVVVQTTRGRYASEGRFEPFVDEGEDGADAIEWVAAQPWCSGRVGMVGGSYVGLTQWRAAAQRPPALAGVAPFLSGHDVYGGWLYRGGAFQLGLALHWTLLFLSLAELQRRQRDGSAGQEDVAALVAAVDANDELYRRLPLTDLPFLRDVAPYYFDWLAHPTRDDYWRARGAEDAVESVRVPGLHVGGWYDPFLSSTLDTFTSMRRRGASPSIRDAQRLVVGPWAHGVHGGAFVDHDFGLRSGTDAIDLTRLQVRWFDSLLRGRDNGTDREKRVRVFVMGAKVWREEDDWPLPQTQFTRYHLHSRGRANGDRGDGALALEEADDEPEDVYRYDPHDPVPTVGGQSFLPGVPVGAGAGPRDQRSVSHRSDVLCYTSESLPEPVEVVGPVVAVLYVSSSALDTDWTAKLVDVWPDGRAQILTDGILRARYRGSLWDPALLQPGRVYEVRVSMAGTANVFGVHHRIRLEVSSSNFPRFGRNTNTGRAVAHDGFADLVPAVNRVHHSRAYPSRLELPVILR